MSLWRMMRCTVAVLLLLLSAMTLSWTACEAFTTSGTAPLSLSLSRHMSPQQRSQQQQQQRQPGRDVWLFSTNGAVRDSLHSSSPSSSSAAEEEMHMTGDDSNPSVGPPSRMSGKTTTWTSFPSRLRQLKDAMWVRECLEDLTAAEFACSLIDGDDDDDDEDDNADSVNQGGSSDGAVANQNDKVKKLQQKRRRKRKRAVDYDNLLTKLSDRLEEMGCNSGSTDTEDDECIVLNEDGMGATTYNMEGRQALLSRIYGTRVMLMKTMKLRERQQQAEQKQQQQQKGDGITSTDQDTADSTDQDQPDPFASLSGLLEESIQSAVPPISDDEETDGVIGPKLYVRDDGTVDWDGALQDRAALRNFGVAVWARINGQDPSIILGDDGIDGTENVGESADSDAVADTHGEKKVVVKIEETEAIRQLKADMDYLQEELQTMETEHLALLNSALKVGQAVANIQMATIDPGLRNMIKKSADNLEAKKEELSLVMLQYELERIFTYLMGETKNNKGYIPLQDRLNVAEFGLLESQVEAMSTQEKDTDVLQVVSDQVTDLKRRLGIDYYVTGLSFDREAIQRWIMELYVKSKQGLAFYVKGCQLFWNDIVFCSSLVLQALQGYTLKPREVRTLRRTFKDVINFIPFVIILIIPLSPVGHVLVFGAIQRVFPDFFPSCFTERRQNLLELYESTEYTEVTIKENWREKVARILEALGFLIVSSIKSMIASFRQSATGGLVAGEDGDDEANA